MREGGLHLTVGMGAEWSRVAGAGLGAEVEVEVAWVEVGAGAEMAGALREGVAGARDKTASPNSTNPFAKLGKAVPSKLDLK